MRQIGDESSKHLWNFRSATFLSLTDLQRPLEHSQSTIWNSGSGAGAKSTVSLKYQRFAFQSCSRISLPSVWLGPFRLSEEPFSLDQPELVMRKASSTEGTSDERRTPPKPVRSLTRQTRHETLEGGTKSMPGRTFVRDTP